MFRGLILTFFCVGCGVLVFAVVSFVFSVFAVAVVSRHRFSFAFGVGALLRGGFVFVLSYPCVSYSDRASKLTIF